VYTAGLNQAEWRYLRDAPAPDFSQALHWARIGEFVGQRSLSVTADTYSHVLADGTKVEYGALLESRPS